MKIRILQVVGTMNRGGAETFLMNVLRNIDISKFEFFFLCYGNDKFDYEDEILKLGGKIIRTPDVKEVGVLSHVKNIRRIIRENNIDIIHAHTYFNSVFSLIAGRSEGLKMRIVHSHTTRSEYRPSIIKQLYFFVSKLLINYYATKRIACGQEAGKSLFFGKNFKVITNGIILQDFKYNKEVRSNLRKRLNIADNTVVIGHVGRIDTQKNQEFVIEIFQQYARGRNDARLLLIGDGVLRRKLEDKIHNTDIEDKVHFLGVRDDVSQLYSVMDVLLFPSLKEGLPVTLVEAQANGLKCLISDTIDKDIKLTDCVEFFSLSENAESWGRQIEQMDLTRINTLDKLHKGSYDMSFNIKNIEKIYSEAA